MSLRRRGLVLRVITILAQPVVALVAWSRLAMARHRKAEVAAGLVLGVVAGGVLVWS